VNPIQKRGRRSTRISYILGLTGKEGEGQEGAKRGVLRARLQAATHKRTGCSGEPEPAQLFLMERETREDIDPSS